MMATTRSTLIRFAMAGVFAASAGPLVAADDPAAGGTAETYAVVALVGDEFTVVTYQPSVGSNLDRNIRQEIPVENAHFDQLATRVAAEALKRTVPGAVKARLLDNMLVRAVSKTVPHVVAPA